MGYLNSVLIRQKYNEQNPVLATTKNNVHRIPLQKGIYGEVTLMYVNKEYQTLPWTYADYRTPAFHEIFKEMRQLLKKRIRAEQSQAES